MTAAKPDRDRTSIRLIAERLDADASRGELGALLATAVGPDATGAPWRLDSMFGATGDPELDRFLEVTGTIDAHSLPGAAWELAYGIRDALAPAGRFDVVPDLPRSWFAPGADELVVSGGPAAALPLASSTDPPWHLERIGAEAAWKIATGKGVGITIGHPDTGYRLVPGLGEEAFDFTRDRDVLNGDHDALDPLECGTFPRFLHPGHGTRTGSVIAGRPSGPLSGVAPRATLVPIRTVKSVIQVFDGDVAKAVVYARRVRCHIVSLSLGGVGLRGLREAIRAAIRSGVIVMAAGGNFELIPGVTWPWRTVVWPAAWPECIGIAATSGDDLLWSGSARGAGIDLAAPGEDIAVPNVWNPARQTRSTGTSFSVAAVAGAAALWLGHHGREDLLSEYGTDRLQAVFATVLTEHGRRRPPGWAAEGGAGILDVPALLRAPLPPANEVLESFGLVTDGLALPPAEDRRERLRHVLPDTPPHTVDTHMSALFGVDGAAVADVLDAFGEELLYILTERPAAQEAFIAGLGGPDSLESVDPARSILAAFASPSLRRMLSQRPTVNPLGLHGPC